jgi:RNA polymerase primary sigma factor
VCSLVRRLPVRHREVLLRRYGFDLGDAQSHEEIAAWLGVGTERSRQLERQALYWLRTVFLSPAG